MNPTTVEELRAIVKTIKFPKRKRRGPYKYVSTMTPELEAAISDPEAFRKYLKAQK